MFFEIQKLKVRGRGKKEILRGINLKIKKGEIQALLGPNASGKSSLAHTILGDPKYKIEEGKILFKGKNITHLLPEKRAKLGIALSWQMPPSIKGLRFSDLLDRIESHQKNKNKIEPALAQRELNVNFSGGEKRISELMQILALNPEFVIFDEIDSGLDIKRLEKVTKIIRKELAAKKSSILLITHQGTILDFLKPDLVNVMVKGQIICQEKNYHKVLKVIKKYGYEKCKTCREFLAD